MISYKEFEKDLLANVDFDNPERIGDDYDKFNNYTMQMKVDGKLADKVYKLNKSTTSDYFNYQGQRFSFGGSVIRCYSKNPLLRNVMGGGHEKHILFLTNKIKVKKKPTNLWRAFRTK